MYGRVIVYCHTINEQIIIRSTSVQELFQFILYQFINLHRKIRYTKTNKQNTFNTRQNLKRKSSFSNFLTKGINKKNNKQKPYILYVLNSIQKNYLLI